MDTKIKICGITKLAGRATCRRTRRGRAWVHLLREKPALHSDSEAADICNALPPFVTKVGVFVDELEFEIEKAVNECLLKCAAVSRRRGRRGSARNSLRRASRPFACATESSLARRRSMTLTRVARTYTDTEQGGTGKTFDWSLAVKAQEILAPPIILSGGLTTANVQDAFARCGRTR